MPPSLAPPPDLQVYRRLTDLALYTPVTGWSPGLRHLTLHGRAADAPDLAHCPPLECLTIFWDRPWTAVQQRRLHRAQSGKHVCHFVAAAVPYLDRQIAAGHAVLVERRPGLREADLALLEIIQGKITIATIDKS